MDPIETVAGQTGADATTVWQRFSVPYEFPVVFTEALFAADNPAFRDALIRLEPARRHRLLVFVDGGVAHALPTLGTSIAHYCDAHAAHLELLEAPLRVPGGEGAKGDWAGLEPVREAIRRHALDRHSYVVAIGGGAVLDAVGLVAATAHRGIRHVRVPSTVLAQNDSGVGVKNGINQYAQKNYLGTFAPPFAVLNDRALLDALPARERRAGMAEAVKVALIRDAAFFARLETDAPALAALDRDALARLVRRCAELHLHQIGRGGDPFELGSARPLDFGHWAAHRLETLSGHALRHGEAVAIGIELDTRYSVLAGLLDEPSAVRVRALLAALGLPLWHPLLERRDERGRRAVSGGLEDFRAHLGGELSVTMLAGIGRGVEVHAIDEALLERAIADMGEAAREGVPSMLEKAA